MKDAADYSSGLRSVDEFADNLQRILKSINAGNPVMLGVNRSEKESLGNTTNPATHHWVVGIGTGRDILTGNVIIYFHEVGTTRVDKGDGRSGNNKLYVDEKERRIYGMNPFKESETYQVASSLYKP